MIDLDYQMTQAEFGSLVGISQPAVSDKVKSGVLAQGATAREWLLAYCDHMREQAAGRASAGDLDLASERAALAKAQREKIEMQNAVTRRELAPVHLIEAVLAKAGYRAARILEAIPGAVRRRAPELPAVAIEHIHREIAKARNIAAAISLEDLADDSDVFADDDEPEVAA